MQHWGFVNSCRWAEALMKSGDRRVHLQRIHASSGDVGTGQMMGQGTDG